MKSCKNDLRAAYIPGTSLPALQTLFQLILTKIQKNILYILQKKLK